MPTPDVYFLTAFEPYTEPRHPVSINALIVHALTLLHPDVPQPDGGMIYRCLTEFPGRREHEIVPVSTLTYELNGGRFWPQIGEWETVTDALVTIARAGGCDAMPLGLTPISAHLIAMGPFSDTVLHHHDGRTECRGPEHRRQELDTLANYLHRFLAEGPLWPGDNLVPKPANPVTLPYQPYQMAPP